MRIYLFTAGLMLFGHFQPSACAQENHPSDQKAVQAWQDWFKKLGQGPIYQVDILFRYQEDGRLYVLQTFLSPAQPRSYPKGLSGLGLDDKGRVLAPPTPGQDRRRMARTDDKIGNGTSKPEKPLPPLAETTRYLGVRIENKLIAIQICDS